MLLTEWNEKMKGGGGEYGGGGGGGRERISDEDGR